MSFLSSIFPTSSGTPVNGGPTQIQGGAPPVSPSFQTPVTPSAPVESTPTPASPLDQFASMWQTAKDANGNPIKPAANNLQQPIFNFDSAKITESAGKMDFMSSVSPDTIQKALSGDPVSFGDAINQAVRAAVVGLTLNQGNLINQALTANNDRITSSIPEHFKRAQLMEPDSDPIMGHAAVQPLVQALKQMAFAKDPSASPAAISKQVSEYLSGLGTAITDASPTNQQKKQQAANEPDWTQLLG